MEYPAELQILYNKLTHKQQKFVDLWNGNGKETAILAGYKSAEFAAVRALKNVNICKLISYARQNEEKPEILNRQQRQKFWSDMMQEKDATRIEKLKASDLLGKSEGDFLLKVEHGLNQTTLKQILDVLPASYAEIIKKKLLKQPI